MGGRVSMSLPGSTCQGAAVMDTQGTAMLGCYAAMLTAYRSCVWSLPFACAGCPRTTRQTSVTTSVLASAAHTVHPCVAPSHRICTAAHLAMSHKTSAALKLGLHRPCYDLIALEEAQGAVALGTLFASGDQVDLNDCLLMLVFGLGMSSQELSDPTCAGDTLQGCDVIMRMGTGS